jgi:hypothetical protein
LAVAVVFYSHLWDFILKIALLLVLLILAISLHVDRSLGVAPMIAIIVVLWLVIYRQGLSTIASWLYARVSLGAPVSLVEARRLARLFQLDVSLKWMPLKEVKKLPKAERRGALMTALETLGPQRKAMLV